MNILDQNPLTSDFGGSQAKRTIWDIARINGNKKIEQTALLTVYLGVGLHNGYGSAQRMYIKRGYIPGGSGVWYGDKISPQYADCCHDDDFVLYLSKKLQ